MSRQIGSIQRKTNTEGPSALRLGAALMFIVVVVAASLAAPIGVAGALAAFGVFAAYRT